MLTVSTIEQRGCPRDSAFEIANDFDAPKTVTLRIETEDGVFVRRDTFELEPRSRRIVDCVYDDDCVLRLCVIESSD